MRLLRVEEGKSWLSVKLGEVSDTRTARNTNGDHDGGKLGLAVEKYLRETPLKE